MSQFKSIILLVMLALVACSGLSATDQVPKPTLAFRIGATATATPALEPTRTFTPPSSATSSPTWTSSPLPTHTPTQTFTPTQTPTPTRTFTPTPTRTPTATNTPTPYPIPTGNITRIDATFRSASLGLDREVIIYLPPGYNVTTQRRYPVLYLLHGWGGFDLAHTTEWEQWGLERKSQDLITKGASQPMIVVQPLAFMPNPPHECSLFFNHGPGTDGKPWGDYIWKDVVNYIDTNYRTLARRESRAIGGFSFGGQGALSLALTHPEVFKVVGAHSPSFRQADGSIGFMNDPAWFEQFDPVWLVKNRDSAKQLSLWLDVAAGDDKVRECGPGSDHCVEAFHELLVSKSIVHAWQDQWPGPHAGTYWEGHIADYMAWYSSQLVGQ